MRSYSAFSVEASASTLCHDALGYVTDTGNAHILQWRFITETVVGPSNDRRECLTGRRCQVAVQSVTAETVSRDEECLQLVLVGWLLY